MHKIPLFTIPDRKSDPFSPAEQHANIMDSSCCLILSAGVAWLHTHGRYGLIMAESLQLCAHE